jgi:hypothetical protein
LEYQFPNSNTKEHLECVVHMDNIDTISVDKT